ncbi:MAG: hypothetical protein OXU69_03390 [Gemmatimonadota bacterium]|nr:hypothetical protein [Gemmatimonadota bacterium]
MDIRVGRGFASAADSLHPMSLDRIVSAVAQDSELNLDIVADTKSKREMAYLASANRHLAAPTATLSESKVKEIVRPCKQHQPQLRRRLTEGGSCNSN